MRIKQALRVGRARRLSWRPCAQRSRLAIVPRGTPCSPEHLPRRRMLSFHVEHSQKRDGITRPSGHLRTTVSSPAHRCGGGTDRDTAPSGAGCRSRSPRAPSPWARVPAAGEARRANGLLRCRGDLFGWGLGDQEPTTDPEKGSGALGHDCGLPEGAGEHAVEARPPHLPATADLGPLLHDRDPVSEARAGSRHAGERRPAARWPRAGPRRRPGQSAATTSPGSPPASSQIQHSGPSRSRSGQATGDHCEAVGMAELGLYRPRA